MSNVSIPLYKVIELTGDDGNGYEFGMDTYPIFDEGERDALNRKIIDHYWMREIGQETIELFTHYMRVTMNEIMPLYNQWYKSAQLEFDPLSTYSLSTVRSGTASENATATANSTNDSNTSSKSRTVGSTTPQNPLSGQKDYASSLGDASGATDVSGTSSGTNTNSGSSQNNETSTTTGRQGSASALLAQYRTQIVNIDMQVINDRSLIDMFILAFDLNPAPVRSYL